MFAKLFASAALAASTALAPHAQAATFDFENLGSHEYITEAYGYQWGGEWGKESWVAGDSTNNPIFEGVAAHSGTGYIWTNFAVDATLSGAAFTVEGFWARGGNRDTTLLVTGYNNGVASYSQSFAVTQTYQLISLSFGSVDSITFSTGNHANLLIDDLTIAQAVPEPETYAMLLAGLGLVGFIARRRKLS